jgi:hypothetical protein
MDNLLPAIPMLAPRALFLVLYVMGIVMALNRQARHPAASRLAIVACVLLIGSELLTAGSSVYLFSHRGSATTAELGMTLVIFNIANLLLHIVGLTLLVLAVFADRNPATVSAASPATTSASR